MIIYTTINNKNKYYFNLKQEFHIRNLFLEVFNDGYNNESNLKAISEYPRINNKRVDLSIYNKELNKSFCIEFKFQFSGDYKMFKKYEDVVYNDFIKRDTSLFILIVAHWARLEKSKEKGEKEIYDENWGVKLGLTKYIAKGNKIEWKKNINNLFGEERIEEYNKTEKAITTQNSSKLNKKCIKITEPYTTEYHFYFLQKKNC